MKNCLPCSRVKGWVPCSHEKNCVCAWILHERLRTLFTGERLCARILHERFCTLFTRERFCAQLAEGSFFLSGFSFMNIHGLQDRREGETISLIHLYHIQPDPRHLGISWAITAESSLLHIAINRARTHIAINRARTVCLWFASAIRKPLSYAPCCVPSLIVKDCIP